jgi:PilZ domain
MRAALTTLSTGRTMDASDNRQIGRDSLFLMAEMRLDGDEADHRIKVRNLSAGGMMGEGAVRVMRGAIVAVNIRNIGWIEGSVAWVQDSRFGVAFCDEIDPRIARAVMSEGEHTPRHIRTPLPLGGADGVLRKI